MKSVSVLFLLICTTLVFGQAWELQNPLPMADNLTAVTSVDAQHIYASSYQWLLRTVDSGTSWERHLTPLQAISRIVALDNDNVWIAGDGYYPDRVGIAESSDGGATWQTRFTLSPDMGQVTDLYFFNMFRAIAVIDGYWIIRTENRGETWTTSELPDWIGGFPRFDFVSYRTGWLIGQPLMHTTDGGETWSYVEDNLTDPVNNADFVTRSIGWCNTFSGLFKTTNGGIDWQSRPLPLSGVISAVCFPDTMNGIVVAEDTIAVTVDGGDSWSLRLLDPGEHVRRLVSEDGQLCVGVGDHGCVIISFNYGSTWIQVGAGQRICPEIRFASFVNAGKGWAAGSLPGMPDYGCVLRTTNGHRWNLLSSGATSPSLGIFAVDSLRLWGSGGNRVLYSSDGGAAWNVAYSQFNYQFGQIQFAGPDTGWVLGLSSSPRNPNIMLRTTTAGQSWHSVELGALSARTFHFANSLHGWCAASTGQILHTTNGGATWNFQNVLPDYDVASIAAVDALVCWAVLQPAVSGPPLLVRTADCGLTWNPVNFSGSMPWLVAFHNVIYGWVMQSDGAVMRTTDGGGSWTRSVANPGSAFNGLVPVDGNHCWAVGRAGTIYGFDALASDAPDTRPRPPSDCALTAFPNPFNPSTSLSFELPRPGPVDLSVFDVTGRLIITISRGILTSGPHSVRFDAAALPAGIYFARLNAPSFQAVSKLVLLK